MDFLIAIAPVALLAALILGAKRSVLFAASCALVAEIVVVLWWGVGLQTIGAASLRGVMVAAEISLLIFSALLVIETIRSQGLLRPIERVVTKFTTDYRVQTLLVALALVSFIEGAAGFGTPALVAVPLLLALGFRPLHAVVLTLIGDTIPVSFGAVGLPVVYGVGSVISSIAGDTAITLDTARIIAVGQVGLLVLLAVLLVGVAVRLRRDSFRAFVDMVPFAVLSGLAVGVPACLVTLFVGPELPSIVGGIAGLVVIPLLARHGIGLPKDAELPSKTHTKPSKSDATARRAVWHALMPYVLLIGLLIVTRLPASISSWLQQWKIGSPAFFGTEVGYTVAPLYSAASILLFCAILTVGFAAGRGAQPGAILVKVLASLRTPLVALLVVLVFVQIFIFSNNGDMVSLPTVIAQSIGSWSGSAWPFFAPLVGALGAFLAGSATVSNLIFTGLQYDIAQSSGLNPAAMLALQTTGASLGNMIALHNVVVALTVAGVSIKMSHRVIHLAFWPMALMLVVLGLAGLVYAGIT